jgi:hypothetical protein
MSKHDEDDEAEDTPEAQRNRRASPARARVPQGEVADPLEAQARHAETIDDRVFVVAQFLMQGRWSRHRALMLANLWAVSPLTIRDYATDAARLARQLKGADGLKALRRKVEAQLDTAFEMAVASGDAKAAVQAAKALGDLGGVFAPKRVAQTDAQGKDVPTTAAIQLFVEMATRAFVAQHGRPPTEAEARALLGQGG